MRVRDVHFGPPLLATNLRGLSGGLVMTAVPRRGLGMKVMEQALARHKRMTRPYLGTTSFRRRRGAAGGDAILKEAAFHRAARACQRAAEVLVGSIAPAGAEFEFAQRCVKEGIRGEAIGVRNDANFLEAAFGAVALRDGDGAIQRDDRRWPNDHELIVKRNDLRPVRVFGATRSGVRPGDGGLEVIFAERRTRGREFEQFLPFSDQMRIPLRAILIEEGEQCSGSIET